MEIISSLIKINQYYYKTICWLLLFICKYIPLKQWAYDELNSPKYQKFKTDKLPIIKKFEKQDYKFLLEYYLWRYGKRIEPIKRKTVYNPIPEKTICPRCGAPHDYIYDNNGGKGQFSCKICGFKFQKGDYHAKSIIFTCPYCRKVLAPKKDRKHFIVHKCVNANCSYYKHNLSRIPKDLPDDQKYMYKLHYIYREFTIDFFTMDLNGLPDWFTSLKFKKNNVYIMGLCLTYNVNLGLSLRKTAQALREIHGINISHTMVARYSKTAAVLVKPFVDSFDYKPSLKLAADETYIKVLGVCNYVWLILDTVSRSILGYHVSTDRGVGNCIFTMRKAFDKFKSFPNGSLQFVADGYSAYPLAAQQFKLKYDWDIPIIPVLGLKNDDAISTEFRPFKQKIERLNRTFKASYRTSCGYNSDDGAYYSVVLWVCYYNFLRKHDVHQGIHCLNNVPDLLHADNMPAKWQTLLRLGQKIILQNQ